MTSAPWDYESQSDGANQIDPPSQATGNSKGKSPKGPALIMSQEAILDSLKTELTAKYDSIKEKLQAELDAQIETNKKQKEELDEANAKLLNSEAARDVLIDVEKKAIQLEKSLEESK